MRAELLLIGVSLTVCGLILLLPTVTKALPMEIGQLPVGKVYWIILDPAYPDNDYVHIFVCVERTEEVTEANMPATANLIIYDNTGRELKRWTKYDPEWYQYVRHKIDVLWLPPDIGGSLVGFIAKVTLNDREIGSKSFYIYDSASVRKLNPLIDPSPEFGSYRVFRYNIIKENQVAGYIDDYWWTCSVSGNIRDNRGKPVNLIWVTLRGDYYSEYREDNYWVWYPRKVSNEDFVWTDENGNYRISMWIESRLVYRDLEENPIQVIMFVENYPIFTLETGCYGYVDNVYTSFLVESRSNLIGENIRMDFTLTPAIAMEVYPKAGIPPIRSIMGGSMLGLGIALLVVGSLIRPVGGRFYERGQAFGLIFVFLIVWLTFALLCLPLTDKLYYYLKEQYNFELPLYELPWYIKITGIGLFVEFIVHLLYSSLLVLIPAVIVSSLVVKALRGGTVRRR